MNDHPLECICSHRKAQFQCEFARQASRLLSLRPDRALVVSRSGLIVSGETEASIEAVIEVLKGVHGEDLRVGDISIRYRQGALIEEPHMGVRVLCCATHFEAVRNDLLSRGAVICDAELSPPIGVVRATVSLSKLLGYSQHLATLTQTKAREVIWLSHYAPLAAPPPPDGCAA